MNNPLERIQNLVSAVRWVFDDASDRGEIYDEDTGELFKDWQALDTAQTQVEQYLKGAGEIAIIDKRHRNNLHSLVAYEFDKEREDFHDWLSEQIEDAKGFIKAGELEEIMSRHVWYDKYRLNRDIIKDGTLQGIDWKWDKSIEKCAKKNGFLL